MLGYSVQGTLMAGIYRRMDTQEALAIRGLSLLISMSPLLLFAHPDSWLIKPVYIGEVALAALLTSLGGWAGMLAFRHLPVGLTTAFNTTFTTLVVIFTDVVCGVHLMPGQLLVITLILCCIISMGLLRSPSGMPHLTHAGRGMIGCMVFGLCLGSALAFLGHASREVDPMLTAYGWESMIGILSVIILVVRKRRLHRTVFSIKPRNVLQIFLFSAPTAIGSGCYMMALTMGPTSIVAAIVGVTMVMNTLLARLLYKERISRGQWILLSCICMLICTLRLLSD